MYKNLCEPPARLHARLKAYFCVFVVFQTIFLFIIVKKMFSEINKCTVLLKTNVELHVNHLILILYFFKKLFLIS